MRVIRFPVARQRRIKVFADLSDEVFDGGASPDRQQEWFRENGPDAPGLLDHLRAHGREYDLVLFWTYRYFPSYFGLPLVADRAVLVPTAEEDPAIDLDVLPEFFDKPAGYIFLTPEERDLVSSRALHPLRHSVVVGIGLEPVPLGVTPRAPIDQLGIPEDYLLYLGRVDRNKGCDALLENFQEYAVDAHGRDARARRPGEDAGAGASADSRARLRLRRSALGAARPCARAGGAVLVREPEHRAARGVEPRRSGAGQRPLQGAGGPGDARQRRPVLHVPGRVRRGGRLPADASATHATRWDGRGWRTSIANIAGRR